MGNVFKSRRIFKAIELVSLREENLCFVEVR